MIAGGAYADVIIFDPRTIADSARYREPEKLATGVRWTILNGVMAIQEGRYSGALAGRVIRR